VQVRQGMPCGFRYDMTLKVAVAAEWPASG
jgi:hypothetical protein